MKDTIKTINNPEQGQIVDLRNRRYVISEVQQNPLKSASVIITPPQSDTVSF